MGQISVLISVFKSSICIAMEFDEFVLAAASIIGVIWLCRHILSFFRWVWSNFFRSPKNLIKEYGSWAIITGSTDGIGKALAFELALKGLNLVLVGRNPAKLEATSNQIRGRCDNYNQVEIRSLVIDFEKFSGKQIAKVIEEGIEGLDIGILINNAGLAFPYPRFFHETDLKLMESVMKVNMDGATWIVRSVLPGMLKKKKGAIVNVGSGSSVVLSSYPLYSVYAATKAYLAMFSRSVYLEYKQKGIDVQCQIPLFVATKMTKFRRSSFFIPSAEMYSKASVRWIGYDHTCFPYWPHSLQGLLLRALVPDTLATWWFFRYFLGLRKKGQEKDLMQAKADTRKL